MFDPSINSYFKKLYSENKLNKTASSLKEFFSVHCTLHKHCARSLALLSIVPESRSSRNIAIQLAKPSAINFTSFAICLQKSIFQAPSSTLQSLKGLQRNESIIPIASHCTATPQARPVCNLTYYYQVISARNIATSRHSSARRLADNCPRYRLMRLPQQRTVRDRAQSEFEYWNARLGKRDRSTRSRSVGKVTVCEMHHYPYGMVWDGTSLSIGSQPKGESEQICTRRAPLQLAPDRNNSSRLILRNRAFWILGSVHTAISKLLAFPVLREAFQGSTFSKLGMPQAKSCLHEHCPRDKGSKRGESSVELDWPEV